MTNDELKIAIKGLSDGGSAQVIADLVLKANNPELDTLFIEKTLTKASEGHHQTREFALAGLKVLRG